MELISFTLIILFGFLSYAIGITQIYHGNYRPNTFSRGIWLLLAFNSTVGVILGHASKSSVLLSLIMLVGSAGIFIGSISRGRRSFGLVEYICSLLLLLSLAVWIFFKTPLINVVISLIAHFIGAIPSYIQVWHHPRSENKAFWFFFFIASLLSMLASGNAPLLKQILPIYFSLFDGSMFALSLRGSGRIQGLFAKN